MTNHLYLALSVCVLGSYGQLISIQYSIKNILRPPTFEETIRLTLQEGEPFIRAMERAADLQKDFEFSASYTGNIGYYISKINGLEEDYVVEKSYWEVFNRTHTDIDGVSLYIPSDGDVVTFNFTSAAHSDSRKPVYRPIWARKLPQ